MADFVPGDNPNLIVWLTNLRGRIAVHGATLGMTAAQITAFQAVLDELITEAQGVSAAKNALAAAVASLDSLKLAKLSKTGLVRSEIAKWKTSGLLTTSMTADMKVAGTGTAFDPVSYKAAITAELHPAFVRIKFKKLGVDGLNIYSRLKGQPAWKKLSFDSNSPYDDHTELAVAGTPEVREYRALGVIADEEIGQPSDIVSVTFAG